MTAPRSPSPLPPLPAGLSALLAALLAAGILWRSGVLADLRDAAAGLDPAARARLGTAVSWAGAVVALLLVALPRQRGASTSTSTSEAGAARLPGGISPGLAMLIAGPPRPGPARLVLADLLALAATGRVRLSAQAGGVIVRREAEGFEGLPGDLRALARRMFPAKSDRLYAFGPHPPLWLEAHFVESAIALAEDHRRCFALRPGGLLVAAALLLAGLVAGTALAGPGPGAAVSWGAGLGLFCGISGLAARVLRRSRLGPAPWSAAVLAGAAGLGLLTGAGVFVAAPLAMGSLSPGAPVATLLDGLRLVQGGAALAGTLAMLLGLARAVGLSAEGDALRAALASYRRRLAGGIRDPEPRDAAFALALRVGPDPGTGWDAAIAGFSAGLTGERASRP